MDTRPSRSNRHPRNPGNENILPPAAKTADHQHRQSTGNLLNMPVTGSFNAAAKRTALGDRNVVPRDASDAPSDGKIGTAQNNSSVSSHIIASKAQENRAQTKPKNAFKKAFFQPAQRPSRTIAPSVSMSQIGLGRASASASATANSTHELRKAFSRASMSNFVYKDPQEADSKAKPAVAPVPAPVPAPIDTVKARAVPEQGRVIRASQVQPSTTTTTTNTKNTSISTTTATSRSTNIKQELVIDLTSPELQSAQPEQPKHQDLRQPSYFPYAYTEDLRHQKPNHLFTVSSLLTSIGASPPDSPGADDDATEPPYLHTVEDPILEHIQFLTNAPAQVLEPTQARRQAVHPPSEPLVPERVDLPQASHIQREISSTESNSRALPQGFVNNQSYYPPLSDSDEEEDYYYDDRGYTTTHSYRSHSDNTTRGETTIMYPPKLTKKGLAEIEAAKQIVESKRTPQDIQEDAWDVSMVAEYGEEIFEYLRQQEVALLPDPYYMDNQGEIQWSMRSVLMDWVVQVHTRFGLLPETLFLTVNYIDRFLSRKVVSINKLQLVGATAILIAAKFEEINCPSVQELVYMVDRGYTMEEILKAERFMLSMLDFELGWPGPMSFLRRISKADDYDLETRTLAKYFLEVVIMDERFVASPPSYIAAGAHCLSRFILRKGEWTPSHVHYSGYTYNQLRPLVNLLLDCCRHARNHHGAVFEKYSDKRYRQASRYVEDKIIQGYTLPFEHRVSVPFSLDYFNDELTRASYAGSQPSSHTGSQPGSHAVKMPIPIHG